MGGGLLAVVVAALLAGQALGLRECAPLVSLSALVGVVLALCALVRPAPAEGSCLVGRLVGGGLLGYVVLAVATEQFAWVWHARHAAAGIAWLVPLAVGGTVLPPRGHWLAGLACWVLLFAGTTALTYSVFHVNSGVGLLGAWIS